MIGSFGQNGKNGRKFLRCDICDFQDAPFRVDIASAQTGDFPPDPAAVVREAGACV